MGGAQETRQLIRKEHQSGSQELEFESQLNCLWLWIHRRAELPCVRWGNGCYRLPLVKADTRLFLLCLCSYGHPFLELGTQAGILGFCVR